jgi:hypothetical protein
MINEELTQSDEIIEKTLSKEIKLNQNEDINKKIIEFFGSDYQNIQKRAFEFLNSKEPLLIKLINSDEFGPILTRFIHNNLLIKDEVDVIDDTNENNNTNVKNTNSMVCVFFEKNLLNRLRNING